MQKPQRGKVSPSSQAKKRFRLTFELTSRASVAVDFEYENYVDFRREVEASLQKKGIPLDNNRFVMFFTPTDDRPFGTHAFVMEKKADEMTLALFWGMVAPLGKGVGQTKRMFIVPQETAEVR